jgi:hypothetical protein
MVANPAIKNLIFIELIFMNFQRMVTECIPKMPLENNSRSMGHFSKPQHDAPTTANGEVSG